jgi:hypothetical protein
MHEYWTRGISVASPTYCEYHHLRILNFPFLCQFIEKLFVDEGNLSILIIKQIGDLVELLTAC